jgi:putative glutamine amidotransferase
MGGTLFQQVQNEPSRFDHRGGPGTSEERYRMKHKVIASGELARIVGQTEFMVNSLHEQAIDRLADGLIAEAVAEDGTVEAVRVAHARGFAIGVQFHPEWHVRDDHASRSIFEAFGRACAAYAEGLKKAA